MPGESVFFDDWIQCLREHYMYVIRTNDKITEPSLTAVLLQNGFSQAELNELRVQATIRAEDMPDDFVPDLNILEPVQTQPEKTFSPHPAECTCPECISLDESKHDADGQPLPPEIIAEQEEEANTIRKKKDGLEPKQLSMF